MKILSSADWTAEFESVQRSMYHLELRRSYVSGGEHFADWLAGDLTPLAQRWDVFAEWLDMVRSHTSEGIDVARVRVIDEPPTDYQSWESWCAADNIAAGETVVAVPRSIAAERGVDVGGSDWWLLDDARLMVQEYDDSGEMVRAWLTTDRAELEVARSQWRNGLDCGTVQGITVGGAQ